MRDIVPHQKNHKNKLESRNGQENKQPTQFIRTLNSEIFWKRLILLGLGLLLLTVFFYNLLGEPVQIQQYEKARIEVQQLVQSLNDVADIKSAEVGQKDTIPKTVYEDLVLLQANEEFAPTRIPPPWATRLWTSGSDALDGVSIQATHDGYGDLFARFNQITGDYLQLVFTTRDVIEFNFGSEFYFIAPSSAPQIEKIEETKEFFANATAAIDKLDSIESDLSSKLSEKIVNISDNIENFGESNDIVGTQELVSQSQRDIIDLLAEFWQNRKASFAEQAQKINQSMTSIIVALKD